MERADGEIVETGTTGPTTRRRVDDAGLLRELYIEIPGTPRPKGRGRPVIAGAHARMILPRQTREYQAFIAHCARMAHENRPLPHGPVTLALTACLARPQRLMRRKDPEGLLKAPTKPDIDNLIKVALDGLVLGGALRDDADVTEIIATKVYHEKTGSPRMKLLIRYHGSAIDGGSGNGRH